MGYAVASDAVLDALKQDPKVHLDGNAHAAVGISMYWESLYFSCSWRMNNIKYIFLILVLYITLGIVLAICAFYIIIASLLIHGARTVRLH